MNATSYQTPDYVLFGLDTLLKNLYSVVKDSSPKVSKDFIVTCNVDDPEELNEYLKNLEYLKKKGIIEKYKVYSSGQEYIEDEDPQGNSIRNELYFIKPECRIKPCKLIDYLIETSRIPKYFIAFIEYKFQKTLILNGKYILSRPRYGGQAYDLFEVIYKNPRKKLTRKYIEAKIKDLNQSDYEIKRRISGLLADLGFKKGLEKIFFPRISQEAIYFRNAVFANEIDPQSIQQKELNNYIKVLRPFVGTV